MANFSATKYPIPEGFPEILEDFARELLRDQPINVHEYGFLYFKAIETVSSLTFIASGHPFQL